MKKSVSLVVCGALISCLSGCSLAGAYGRELEETVLVQVLGVDVMDGRVTLTAAGTKGEDETALETASGATLEEAFRALPTAGEEYLSLTNVTRILLGDGADVRAVLDYVLEDPDMSWTATVWAADGFAGKMMEEMEDGGIGRLDVLEQSGAMQPSVKSVLAELSSDGETALPVLALRGGTLETVGKLHIEVRR